jgi:hypothetical protein
MQAAQNLVLPQLHGLIFPCAHTAILVRHFVSPLYTAVAIGLWLVSDYVGSSTVSHYSLLMLKL